ncbi:MAG: hypothetical protein U5O39_10655 [Gammaproteobacteria bacterium]|nr:hypothetical protein [Gammaproteobacteria bacterium]
MKAAMAFNALSSDGTRKVVGLAKLIASLCRAIGTFDTLGFGQSETAARTIEFSAFGLWLVVLAFTVAQQVTVLFGPEIASLLQIERSLLPGSDTASIPLNVLSTFLLAWMVAWALMRSICGCAQSP